MLGVFEEEFKIKFTHEWEDGFVRNICFDLESKLSRLTTSLHKTERFEVCRTFTALGINFSIFRGDNTRVANLLFVFSKDGKITLNTARTYFYGVSNPKKHYFTQQVQEYLKDPSDYLAENLAKHKVVLVDLLTRFAVFKRTHCL